MEKKLEEKFNEFFMRIDEKKDRRNERMEVITKKLESNDKMVQYVIDNNIGFNRIDADTKKRIKRGNLNEKRKQRKGIYRYKWRTTRTDIQKTTTMDSNINVLMWDV